MSRLMENSKGIPDRFGQNFDSWDLINVTLESKAYRRCNRFTQHDFKYLHNQIPNGFHWKPLQYPLPITMK